MPTMTAWLHWFEGEIGPGFGAGWYRLDTETDEILAYVEDAAFDGEPYPTGHPIYAEFRSADAELHARGYKSEHE